MKHYNSKTRNLIALALVFLFIISATVFTACTDDKDTGDTPNTSPHPMPSPILRTPVPYIPNDSDIIGPATGN